MGHTFTLRTWRKSVKAENSPVTILKLGKIVVSHRTWQKRQHGRFETSVLTDVDTSGVMVTPSNGRSSYSTFSERALIVS
jgi:hypothetical protein